MEQLELVARRGSAGASCDDSPVEALRDELAHEHVVAVRPEGMAVAETVAGDPLAGDQTHG